MASLINLSISLKALSSNDPYYYPNWNGTGYIRVNGVVSLLINLPSIIYSYWIQCKDPWAFKAWHKNATLEVQKQLNLEMNWAATFIATMTNSAPSTHSKKCARLLYLSKIAHEMDGRFQHLGDKMKEALDHEYVSMGIDELRKLPEKIKENNIFLQWCGFTDVPFPMDAFTKFFTTNEPLDPNTNVVLRNWINDFNEKSQELQSLPDRHLNFTKFHEFLVWLLEHFQQERGMLSPLCFALHKAGLHIFSLEDKQYKAKRLEQIEKKCIGEMQLTECIYQQDEKYIYATNQGAWVAFYTHNPLTIFAEYGAKGLEPGLAFPTVKSIKKIDEYDHLVLSPIDCTPFDFRQASHITALIEALKNMVSGHFIQIFHKEALRVGNSLLYQLNFTPNIEGIRHDLLEPRLFELVPNFEKLSQIYTQSGLNQLNEIRVDSTEAIAAFFNTIKNLTNPLWNADEKQLENFLLEQLPNKTFSLEEMNMYTKLLVDVRKTVRYCQEQIKQTYPGVYEDEEFVGLVGIVILTLRTSKMLCMQIPFCLQQHILTITKKLTGFWVTIFSAARDKILNAQEINQIIVSPKDQQLEKKISLVKRLEKQTPRILQTLLLKDPEISALLTDETRENFAHLTDCAFVAFWFAIHKYIQQQPKTHAGSPSTNVDVIKHHALDILRSLKGFCGNTEFLCEEITKKMATIKQ